ncbi:MAG: ribosome-binding factor A [Gammaproteobacteria bacterium]
MSSAGAVRLKSYPRGHRIASLVRRGLSPIVTAAYAGATVRRVSLNGDFSVATVHFSLLSGDAAAARELLSRDAPRMRRRLAASLNMRATPKLVFAPDEEGMAADDMQKFLDSLAPDASDAPQI